MEVSTRGDGNEGENVTHNVRGISGIPIRIPYQGRLVVAGEAFIRTSHFEQLKSTLLDSSGQPYKNGRNLAAGSVRLLYKDGIAYKFADERYETRMTCIEWTPSRTGEIAPAAVLEFERYLIAMDIPQIGNTASRTLARQFHNSLDEFEAAISHFTRTEQVDGTGVYSGSTVSRTGKISQNKCWLLKTACYFRITRA